MRSRTPVGNRWLPAIGLAAAVVYLLLVPHQRLWTQLLLKPLPVLCLALAVMRSQPDTYGRRITAGLLLAMAGDLALVFPGENAFLAGLVLNLGAQIAYSAAFVGEVRTLHLGRALPFAIWLGGLYAVLYPGLGAMKLPAAAYAAAIGIALWRAAACVGDPASTRRSQWAGLLGAVGFALCDSMIALDQFHRPIANGHFWVMVSYWLGQLGLAWSAVGRRAEGAAETRAAPPRPLEAALRLTP